MTQYAHAAWRVQDGEMGGQAASITQTKDGYLWVGTEAGLERYDGVRFRHWTLPLERPVFAIEAARDGSLWVGLANRLLHLKDGRTDSLTPANGRINGLHEDAAGAIWIARSRTPAHEGGLCTMQGKTLRCFGAAQGQPCDYAATLTQDVQGDFWIAGATGVCAWGPGGGKPALKRSQGAAVQALAAEADGSMLIGFMRSGSHLGLQRVTKGDAQPVRAEGFNGEDLQVTALLRDRQGSLWVGTATAGIYHIDHGRVDRFTSADGLSANSVNRFFEDREGNVWVATTGGVDRFHRHAVSAVTTREGLTGDRASSVLARRDGSIWISSINGLAILKNGVIVPGGVAKRFSGHTVTSMAEDHAGQVWLGFDDDLVSLDGRTLRPIRRPDGGKLGVIVGLAEDDLNDIWAISTGRPYRLYRVRGGRSAEEVHLAGGGAPYALAAGRNGAVWMTDEAGNLEIHEGGRARRLEGPQPAKDVSQFALAPNDDVILSTTDGAYYLSGRRWTLLSRARGLPCDNILAAIVDQQGALWLRGQCGMMIIAGPALRRALEHPQEKLAVRLLDGVDGAQPGRASFSPAAAASPDGQLWFATDNVLLTAHPAHLSTNPLPPPVRIERVVADHRIYAAGRSISLAPRTHDVEIDYAGLSLVAPQKMRFRYRLLGVDNAWQHVGTRRAAFYMNLKPGHYRFQVVASNNDGVWNTAGDSLELAIRPTFYQTLWFQVCAAALLLGLVWLGLWLRVRFLTAEIETRLSERQAERMRIARELHDTLLQGFQGLLMRFQVVADAIPKRSPAKPMMEAVLSRAEDVLIEGRDRVHDLRSAETASPSLFDDLQHLAFAFERDGLGPIEVGSIGTPRPLSVDVQREILAIAKEALANACRHARATTIRCHLTFTRSHVRLVCEDNGIGIDEGTLRAGGREGHWGLTGMRERARQAGGALSVRSAPGETRVAFSLNTRIADLRRLVKQLTSLEPARRRGA